MTLLADHFKDQRTNLQRVAVAELALIDKALTVNEGTVAAAQVANADGVPADEEHAVLAADQFAVGADMAFGAAADDELAFREVEVRAVWLPLDDFHLHAHVRLPSRLSA
jgi:hypothetical protein